METPIYASEMDAALHIDLSIMGKDTPVEQVLVARRWAKMMFGNPYHNGADGMLWNIVGDPHNESGVTGCAPEGLIVHKRASGESFAILDVLSGSIVDWHIEQVGQSVLSLVGPELPNMAANREEELVFPGSPIDDALLAKQGLIASRSAMCRHGFAAITNVDGFKKLTFGGLGLAERELTQISELTDNLSQLEERYGPEKLYTPPIGRLFNLALAGTMAE